VSTWRSRAEQPIAETLGQIAERHLGPANDKRLSFGDGEALSALLVAAGFADVQLAIVEKEEVYADLPIRLGVLAAGHDLSRITDAEREEKLAIVEAESRAALAAFTVDGRIRARNRTNLVTARRPS
jgi:hypothetical protein